MTILTRNKTQKNRYVTISKFEIDRCYRLARIQLSKELSSNITESYARTLYSPSLEDIEYINNSQALQDIFYTKLKNKYYFLNNKEQTFLCINLDKNYYEKDGESDESISSETTSSGYDTSTSTSTFSNDDDDYSTIETFADHDIDWIRSTLDEYEEHGEIWDHHRGLLFFNIVAPFIFIIFMILLKKFFDFND
ncbi:unnamed protein product [Rhizophagus irregularis]|uniref:Uncharacterized protein n=5 Tax=Rhizophagus irregularis TaxID=588596 RepID=A0A2I1E381_9GLOM|nr:hypothetical protein GLOIN_2v1780387 [Rhizophagus irregularis DAOM 181602=DAOM 197198]EXX73602.1 hypothetical protein RirG_058960 [Rhizophagus irregularis DAOM 197198w]PKY16561.1 hypothetical protein RhiirB3_381851 [Rhizophagus irregularis]POG66624.1 hypothetical protein GLOIN_2v1780387 [Rhizophagus irregularis DAOM 181602=DAOM 197198]UZO20559.1 hypothetical protein OCT59_012982 [Rhizophagus irregularis]CAB4442202.1 unnamed protein product [Rhizophagus irregularis]|eukprot:XP_025173490.1 hypothetical protein GLOIN_2v1780387 [Rhizophagus irregularis DAOM 181602=DAOM 197198]